MKKFLVTILSVVIIISFSKAQTPVAYYPFNGNANDTIGSLNGIISGTVSFAADRNGVANNAGIFNGSSRIDVADNLALRPTNLTLSVWFYSLNPQTEIIVSKNLTNTASNSYALFFLNGSIAAAWGNAGGVDFFSGPVPSSSVWHHVALTFDDANNTAILYLDGVVVNSKTTGISLGYDNSTFSIGSELENGIYSSFINGQLDDVKIFNTALTASQIASEFNNGAIANDYRSAASGN